MRTILFYQTPNGQKPVEIFLDSLASKPAQKVVWVLQLIEEIEFVPAQYLKKLVNTDGIWEVRVQFGGNIYRLLGFFEEENFLVLTSGFTKKTQKTPANEIKLAEQRKRDHLKRKREGRHE